MRHADFIPLRRPYTDPSIAPSAMSSPADFVINNPFSLSMRPQPSPSQVSGSTTPAMHHSSFNPFIHGIPPDDLGSTKIPPLPPRKLAHQMAAPQPPPRHVATRTNRLERSLSPSKRSTATSAISPKPSQHVTSTLIKQSLQASKVAQTMKKAEEQLERERVMQVLKSSSVVSGAYPLAGASVVGSSVVIGTNIHNQHQHQYPAQGPPKAQKLVSASISSGSEGNGPQSQVPPLPKRRTARAFPPPSQQPSPPPSEGSLEQVALASPQRERSRTSHETDRHFNFFNEEDPATHPLPVPPPTHPDRKPNFGYQQLPPSPDPQSPPPFRKAKNLETFEAIYGPMSTSSLPQISPSRSANGTSTNKQDIPTTFATPLSLNTSAPPTVESPTTRASRSHSLTQTTFESTPPPPPIRRRRPESIQSFSSNPGEALLSSGNQNGSTGTLSKHVGRSGSGTLGHKKSSLSLSSTSSFINHTPALSSLTNEFKPRRLSSGASSAVAGSTTGSSTTTAVGSNIQRTIEALHSFHGQLQPKLEKARYKAEAGFSRRGYVRGPSVRASAEGSPARADVEEKEGLTRGYNTRGGIWRDTFREESELSDKLADRLGVDRGGEGNGTDEDNEYRRGRSETVPIRLHNSRSNLPQYTPRNVYDDSPERDLDEFNGFGRTTT